MKRLILHFKIGVPQIISNGVRHYKLTRISETKFKVEDLFPSEYFPQPSIELELLEWEHYLLRTNKKFKKKGLTYLYSLRIFSNFESATSVSYNLEYFEWFGEAGNESKQELDKRTVHLIKHLNLKERLWIRQNC